MSKYDNSEYRVPARQDQETIKRQAARLAELTAILQTIVDDARDCEACDGTGITGETKDACRYCGGYGFNVGGDIREHVIDARNLLEGAK